MDFFHDVLNKAKEEGKIAPELLPWEAILSEPSDDAEPKIEELKPNGPSQRPPFPDELSMDVQRISENMRFLAKERGLQVIGMVSAGPNEGTSTLAAMISVTTAGRQNGIVAPDPSEGQNNSRAEPNSRNPKRGVVLIDAQLKHPVLHKMFGRSTKPGLVELLSDQNSLDTVLQSLLNLDLRLIAIGDKGKVAWIPSDTERLRPLLESLKAQFEFVFLDIPPLLHYAEGTALCKLCDGVILVVRAGETRWEVVEEAKRFLDKAGVNLLGAVLNRREFFIPEGVYRRL